LLDDRQSRISAKRGSERITSNPGSAFRGSLSSSRCSIPCEQLERFVHFSKMCQLRNNGSCRPYCTVKYTVAVRVMLPFVAMSVNGYVPAGVVEPVTTRICTTAGRLTEEFDKVTVPAPI
jgi:hypothetical protein